MTSDSVETSIKLRLDQRPNHVQCQCQYTSNSIIIIIIIIIITQFVVMAEDQFCLKLTYRATWSY